LLGLKIFQAPELAVGEDAEWARRLSSEDRDERVNYEPSLLIVDYSVKP
jgi:hypothetical protein